MNRCRIEITHSPWYTLTYMAFIKKYWKWLAILLVLTAGIIIWQQYAKNQHITRSVTTVKAKNISFQKKLTSSGKTKADRSVDLKFQTSGKLAWVQVKEGDYVNAYQALAGLDARDVQLTLEKSLRDYAAERNDFDQSVVDSPASKPSDAANDRVRRILEKNQWDLDKAVLDVEFKHLAVEYSTLVTPIAGIVTGVDTPVAGVNITPATAVFSVADPSSIIFVANVDETEVGSLSVGQRASIFLDAYPDNTFDGVISYISYTAEQSSGGATVFPVKISFAVSGQSVRIGLNGDIEIVTEELPKALVIPTEALRENDDGTYVHRLAGSEYIKTPVTVTSRNDDVVVVTKGLSEGDFVVTKGFSSLPK